MITTIIFDLGEVYLRGLLGIEKELSKVLKISEIEILLKINNKKLKLLFEGKISEDEYLIYTIDKNNWKIEIKEFKDIIRSNFREILGTRDLIENLHKKQFKLGLLSVHAKEWIEYCEKRYNYHYLFDIISYSYLDGPSKPEKKSFLNILEKLNSKPEECLFIDDSKENIKIAENLGIKVVLFRDSKSLKNYLQNLSINT